MTIRKRLDALEAATPAARRVCEDPKAQAAAMRSSRKYLASRGIKPRPPVTDPKAQQAAMRSAELFLAKRA